MGSIFLYLLRPFLYMYRYRRNIEHLKYEVRDGKEIRDEARWRGNIDNNIEVETWLQNINQKLNDAMKVLEDAGEGESAGYLNPHMQNCISNYQLSKKAEKLAQDIAMSLDSDVGYSFQVADVPSSKMVTTEDILKALEDNDVKKIGLHGIASGRMTAEVSEVLKIACGNGIFLDDDVIKLNVPQKYDLMKIQAELAGKLGVQLITNNDEHREENARLINEKLVRTDTKTLVIFNDVHEYLNLNAMGIRDGANCKIVITSREERVCNEMGSQKNFNMKECISETWSTFKEATKDWQEKAGLDSIAKELVEDCEDFIVDPDMAISFANQVKTRIDKITKPTEANPDQEMHNNEHRVCCFV